MIVDTSQAQSQLFGHLGARDGGVLADKSDDGVLCGAFLWRSRGRVEGMECEFKAILEAILRHGVRRLNDSQVDVTSRAEFFAQRIAIYSAMFRKKNEGRRKEQSRGDLSAFSHNPFAVFV